MSFSQYCADKKTHSAYDAASDLSKGSCDPCKSTTSWPSSSLPASGKHSMNECTQNQYTGSQKIDWTQLTSSSTSVRTMGRIKLTRFVQDPDPPQVSQPTQASSHSIQQPVTSQKVATTLATHCSEQIPLDRGTFVVNGLKYQIMKQIGVGGSCKVYQVMDEDNALKAVKVVDLTHVTELEATSFRNEISMLKKLSNNDRIVRLYGHEEVHRGDKLLLLLVMELGENDLNGLLKEYRVTMLTSIKIKFYWEGMLEAVQVIHNEGIVHSDLKPANFLIVKGIIKLIDFGIASSVRLDQTHITQNNLIGTISFMSPESLCNVDGKGFRINFKSDVWSLGCILYNMVYGKLPFSHLPNFLAKCDAIRNPSYEINYPQKTIYGCDPLVEDVLRMCLVRDPAKRASIKQLLAHPFLRGDSETADVTPHHPKSSKKKNVEEILSALSTLTPNSRRIIVDNLMK